jgi:hypothetical protein
MTALQDLPLTPPAPPPRSVLGGAVERADAVLAEAAEAAVWSLADAELAGLVVAAGRLVAQAQGVLLRLVGEADAREALTAQGATSTAAFLRHRLRLSPAEAAACAKTARATRTMAAATGAACAAGRVTAGQATVITRAVGELPAGPVRAAAERALLAHAATYDPVVLGRLGRRIAAHVDPDAGEASDAAALVQAEQRAARRVELSLSPDGEGGSWLRGRLDAEGTAVVRAALDPLSAPRPSTTDGPDPRPAGRRRGEALVEVCRRVLAGGQLPATGGDRPLVVVTVPLRTLTDGVGTGTLDDGTPISPAAARRLACDAAILPAVLGGASQPLDLARTRRLFTGPLRRALVLRDRGCAFPGCDRPPGWCEAHHIRHWANGGPTTLANGVLLCGAHQPPHRTRRLAHPPRRRRHPRLPPTTLDRPHPPPPPQPPARPPRLSHPGGESGLGEGWVVVGKLVRGGGCQLRR